VCAAEKVDHARHNLAYQKMSHRPAGCRSVPGRVAGLGPPRPMRDEDRPQGQGGDDAECEHPLLVLAGHRERRHDDHEDERVADGQALSTM
jgi:hypothetical protein